MKVVALAGGVGGAKMAYGLAKIMAPGDLTVIVNVGDDFDLFGLRICPDLDTVCYTLAKMEDKRNGWGREHESWRVLDTIRGLGGPTWFGLGDRDFGLHLERTRQLQTGVSLSSFCEFLCKLWKINQRVLPVTNDTLRTIIHTRSEGPLPFQEYFVKERCLPSVTGFSFIGANVAKAAPGVLECIDSADVIVICPSNPWVSIDPILAVREVNQVISKKNVVVAVSPIIGGRTIKGPAAKMFLELGIDPSAYAVAQHYKDLLRGIVIDNVDVSQRDTIADLGISALATNTVMQTRTDRTRLAKEVMEFCAFLGKV